MAEVQIHVFEQRLLPGFSPNWRTMDADGKRIRGPLCFNANFQSDDADEVLCCKVEDPASFSFDAYMSTHVVGWNRRTLNHIVEGQWMPTGESVPKRTTVFGAERHLDSVNDDIVRALARPGETMPVMIAVYVEPARTRRRIVKE
jgi:hypothetical protein